MEAPAMDRPMGLAVLRVLAAGLALVAWTALFAPTGLAAEDAGNQRLFLPRVEHGSADLATLSPRPRATGTVVGRDLWVDLAIEGRGSLTYLAVTVAWDPALLLAVDEDADDYFIAPLPGDWPPRNRGYAQCHADNARGRLRCVANGDLDIAGGGNLARLRLAGKAPGTVPLTVIELDYAPRRPMAGLRLDGESATVTVVAPPRVDYSNCADFAGESYGRLTIEGRPSNLAADRQPDINLGRRGAELVEAYRGLVDHTGPSDPRAPQLGGLVAALGDKERIVALSSAWQLQDWDWAQDRPTGRLRQWPATLVGVGLPDGEPVRVPHSGYHIGSGYAVLVLYAAPGRATLKYTREDNVVAGYTLHLEGVCIAPRLQALYDQSVREGRGRLPALRAGQAFARAAGGEVRFAIRDTGSFMDPRTRKDWWLGYAR